MITYQDPNTYPSEPGWYHTRLSITGGEMEHSTDLTFRWWNGQNWSLLSYTKNNPPVNDFVPMMDYPATLYWSYFWPENAIKNRDGSVIVTNEDIAPRFSFEVRAVNENSIWSRIVRTLQNYKETVNGKLW